MENVTFILIENPDGTKTEHAIIDRGNEEFTSMPKSYYDTLPSELVEPASAEKPKK
jgi:hypothetical protein